MNRLANALLALGVGKGDAVGLFLPMSVQVVAGFYAIAKIGAIVVPIFSGFGAPAVAARLADAGAVAAAHRRRRAAAGAAGVDEGDRRRGASRAAPSVRPSSCGRAWAPTRRCGAGRDHDWDELVSAQQPGAAPPRRSTRRRR